MTVAYIVLGCRALLALVFATSLVGKFRRGRAFPAFVTATRRLAPRAMSESQGRWAAAGVVAAEVCTVIALLVPGWTLAGFLLASALLAVFSVVLLLALRRGERTPCHCFGSSSQRPLGSAPVLRNAALLLVVALGVFGIARAPSVSVTSAGVAITMLAAVVAVVPLALSDELAGLFRTESRPRPSPSGTRSEIRRSAGTSGATSERK